MPRRSTGLSSLRNDANKPQHPVPGQPAKQGVVQPMSFQLPPFDLFHPIQSIKQRRLVKQHQTDLLARLLDKDREAYSDRVTQDENGNRHAYRLDKYRERISAEDDLAEALAEGQTKLTAVAQHYQRLTAINTDNQLSLLDELVKDAELKGKLKESLRRQAANTFIELEALAMNENLNPQNYGVVG